MCVYIYLDNRPSLSSTPDLSSLDIPFPRSYKYLITQSQITNDASHNYPRSHVCYKLQAPLIQSLLPEPGTRANALSM